MTLLKKLKSRLRPVPAPSTKELALSWRNATGRHLSEAEVILLSKAEPGLVLIHISRWRGGIAGLLGEVPQTMSIFFREGWKSFSDRHAYVAGSVEPSLWIICKKGSGDPIILAETARRKFQVVCTWNESSMYRGIIERCN